MFWLFLVTSSADEKVTGLFSYVEHVDSSVQIRALEALIESQRASEAQILMGWGASDLHIRERLADALYRVEDEQGLQKGWSIDLSDQERCRLALRLSTMGHTKEMVAAASAPVEQGPSWPVFSHGTLEDKWTCAIASATLLTVDAPLRSLLERGDFPFSMPFVWDVYNFATKDTLQKMVTEMEWVEEGLRAPLWTALLLNPFVGEDVTSVYPMQVAEWSIGECLDATEFSWAVGLRYPEYKGDVLDALSILQKHSLVCKDWAQIAKKSVSHRLPRSILRRSTDIFSDKDDVLGSLKLVSTRENLTKREVRKVRKQFYPLLYQELEPTTLIELLRGLHLWTEPSDVEVIQRLDDLERRTTDAVLLVELSIVRAKLHALRPQDQGVNR